jgi:hypothetical protein
VTDSIIEHYLLTGNTQSYSSDDGPVKHVEVFQEKNEIHVEVEYKVGEEHSLDIPNFGFVIYDQLNSPICGFNPSLYNLPLPAKKYKREGVIKIVIREPKLLDGKYNFSFWFGVNALVDIHHVRDAICFEVLNMAEHRQLPISIVGPCSPTCDYSFE